MDTENPPEAERAKRKFVWIKPKVLTLGEPGDRNDEDPFSSSEEIEELETESDKPPPGSGWRRKWDPEDPKDDLDEERAELEELIKNRMYELRETQTFLAQRAQKFARYSTLVKASVIILGALVATKETISVVIGTSNTLSIVGYTLAGVLIAVFTGLEASFGWGTRAGKLATLAATCRATRQRAELERTHISSKANAEAKLALETLLDKLMTQLQEVREETIGFGLNPVRDVSSSTEG